jgi:hypothetical protein
MIFADVQATSAEELDEQARPGASCTCDDKVMAPG